MADQSTPLHPATPADPKKEYSEADLDKLFKEAGKRGAVLALLHFDAYGKDGESIKASLVELAGRIQADPAVVYCKGAVEDVYEKKLEDGSTEYSTYMEVKTLFENVGQAVSLCLKYAPVSVEVLEPKELKLDSLGIQNLMLDASGISQQYTLYYMQKMLKGGELEDFQRRLKERADRGKEYIKKSSEKTE